MRISKFLFSAFLLLSISYAGFSQSNYEIVFDFYSKKLVTSDDTVNKIKYGDFVTVKLVNFNPYLYQAQVSFSDSSIATNTPPALFSSFFNTTDLTSLVANLGGNLFKIFPGATHGAAGGPLPVAPTRADSIKAAKDLMVQHRKEIQANQASIETLTQNTQEFIFNQNIKLLSTKKWNLKSAEIDSFKSNDKKDFIDKVKESTTSISNISRTAVQQSNDYENKTMPYGKLIKDDQTLRYNDSLINLSDKTLTAAITAFDTTFTYAKFETILGQLINLEPSNFSYTSLPAQIKDDLSKIDIAITPWSNTNLSSYKTSLLFPRVQKKYLNFSTDFYVSGMHDEHYYAAQKIASPGDTTYAIQEENSGKAEVGISALLHYGWYLESGGNTSFQLTFGPGISIQKNIKPRLLAGLGFGFGRKNKILVSTGVIVGESDRLRSYYKANPVTSFSPTDLTTSVLKVNAFLSIGYAIF